MGMSREQLEFDIYVSIYIYIPYIAPDECLYHPFLLRDIFHNLNVDVLCHRGKESKIFSEKVPWSRKLRIDMKIRLLQNKWYKMHLMKVVIVETRSWTMFNNVSLVYLFSLFLAASIVCCLFFICFFTRFDCGLGFSFYFGTLALLPAPLFKSFISLLMDEVKRFNIAQTQ